MTITRQQVDAWDAEVNAAYERGRQEGMKQERALWTLTKLGQEIEAQPVQELTCPECKAAVLYECVACSSNNYPPKPEQEPVCWVMPDGKTVDKWGRQFYGSTVGEPLYTAPQQRPWVGLTAEEIHDTDGYKETREMYRFAHAIEAKLKEKNT
jgi:hypothetical protein